MHFTFTDQASSNEYYKYAHNLKIQRCLGRELETSDLAIDRSNARFKKRLENTYLNTILLHT